MSAGALSIALLAATAIVRVTGAHLYLQPAGTMAVQFGQKLDVQTLMNPTVFELRSAADAADFPVQFPAGLPAHTPLRRLLLVEHNMIMLQYDLPGAWRRNENQLWIVLTNPRAVTAPSDEQSVGHLLPLGPFGPRGKVQERWQIGAETVIIVQSKALPGELATIKHAMLARLAQRNRSLVSPRWAACRPHETRDASVANSVAPKYPESVAQTGRTRTTEIQVMLDTNGHVRSTSILRSSHSEALDASAETAAVKSTYTPKCVNGEPVSSKDIFRADFARE
jgi:TonB family protein